MSKKEKLKPSEEISAEPVVNRGVGRGNYSGKGNYILDSQGDILLNTAETFKVSHDTDVGAREINQEELNKAKEDIATIRKVGSAVLAKISDNTEREKAQQAITVELESTNSKGYNAQQAVERSDNFRKINLYDAREHYQENAMGYKVAALEDAHAAGVDIQLGNNSFDQAAQAEAKRHIDLQQDTAA